MTPEEQIAKMTKAITQAIKVLGDPFQRSREGDSGIERVYAKGRRARRRRAQTRACRSCCPRYSCGNLGRTRSSYRTVRLLVPKQV